jgi:hypothetical protein
MREFRKGDIYSWKYKPEIKDKCNDIYLLYHCLSQIAIVNCNRKLEDTYYWSGGAIINPEDVELTFLGNLNDYATIPRYDKFKYNPDDIIDLRNENYSNAPLYLRKGATESYESKLKHYKEELESIETDLRYAIGRKNEILQEINNIKQIGKERIRG